MKIAVIADVHGNLEALKAVLTDAKEQKPEQIWCLGDLVGYGPYPNEVIQRIQDEGIPTIQGNYDEGVGNDLMACGCDYKDEKALEIGAKSLIWSQEVVSENCKKYLRELPAQRSEEIGNWRVLFVHGSPRFNNEYLFENSEALTEVAAGLQADVLLCGHTHLPYHATIGEKQIINAGSVGKPKHGSPDASYVLVEFDEDRVQVETRYVSYDYEKAAKAVETSGLPVEFAQMLRTGRA